MCNAAIATTILEVIQQKVLDQKVFTSYDVILEVREGTSDNVRHADVRDIVSNEFSTRQMKGYTATLCKLSVAVSPEALVYSPIGKSADDHPLVESDEEDEIDEDEDDDDFDDEDDDEDDALLGDLGEDEYKLTADGRINIPKKMLAQVSASAGTYDVLINGSLKCANATKRGCVKVSLRAIGIANKVKLTVDTANNTLNVETV